MACYIIYLTTKHITKKNVQYLNKNKSSRQIDECTGLVFESDPYIFNQLELELQGKFEEWIRL